MSHALAGQATSTSESSAAGSSHAGVGKQSRVDGTALPFGSAAGRGSPAVDAVQANTGGLAGPDVGAAAERGVAGASAPLPHLDAIQRSFGRHDVGGVRAQVGGAATEATQAMGAQAYATGNSVAFASSPDLHTAAHEAAHTVQQAGGVQLKDGVGQVGDHYEQHADAVADAVVSGKSAEGLLDGYAGGGKAGAAGAATQHKAVQRLAAVYKSEAEIKAMRLSAFDSYANAQADWATSATLAGDKEKLRSLLAFARKDKGLVLGGCGDFLVSDLMMVGAGQGSGGDANLVAYSKSAGIGKNAGTIHVEVPATSAAEAADWGAAIGQLTRGLHGLIIERVIPQNGSRQCLKMLVDAKASLDLVKYYTDVKPLLDADNGMEIVSYLEFRKVGGQGKYLGYKTALPEIRNYHRFSVAQLDALVTKRAAAAGNKASPTPKPICVLLQSAFDHNGAFHQDPNLLDVITRPGVITLVAEGKASLAAYGAELTKFAAFGKDGKVDEVMIAGHGNAKLMELAGDKGVGQNSAGDQIYGTAKNERVVVDKNATPAALQATDDLITTIKTVLRDDPGSRVVLNACLTASNSVDNIRLDPDPDKAALQIKQAIAADPSLATAVKTKLGSNKAQVRGANASFGQVELLDSSKKLDIVSTDDPKLTAPKLEYAEGGTEPTGVLRATLESWANDRPATIDALKRRIAAKAGDRSWDEKVIYSVMKLIVAEPTNAQLISTLTDTAGTLGHIKSRADCKVASVKGHVPDAHMDAIFTDLQAASFWTMSASNYIPAVLFQVWCAKTAGKIPAFLSFLDASTFDTLSASSVLDLTHLAPMAAQLMPTPPTPATPPRGAFLIALLYLAYKNAGAPAEAKAYIKSVVAGGQAFPSTCNVATILKGASQQRVLEDAGVIAKATATAPVPAPVVSSGVAPAPVPSGPAPNLSPTGTGNNTLAVNSVTQTCKTWGIRSTDAYMLPAGNKVGTIAPRLTLNVVGTTKGTKQGGGETDFLAVEHTIGGNKTVFVDAADVKMS